MAKTVQTYENRIYSDLDLNFNIHPLKKDINKNLSEKAVIFSIKNLLMTSIYEKPFLPEFGSNVRKLLFEPLTPVIGIAIQREINEIITTHEPRVQLKTLKVTPNYEKNAFNINLEFKIKNISRIISVNFLLERLR